MDPIKPIMMTQFLSPNSGDLWIFPSSTMSVVLMSMMIDSPKVLKDHLINFALFVTHFVVLSQNNIQILIVVINKNH